MPDLAPDKHPTKSDDRPLTTPGRVVSMDQFRGYTVVGMFVVNFLAGLSAIHPVFHHNNNYFSFADSIMPSFMFAVGFSYRLTFLRRLKDRGRLSTCLSYFRRSLALVLISLVMYGTAISFGGWESITSQSLWEKMAQLIKADLWEVLAIIGVTQIFVMPLISASAGVRVCGIVVCAVVHVLISYWFNWDFVHGVAGNWMDELWGTRGMAWDGGCFGIIAWGIAMLAGSLSYDIIAGNSPSRAAQSLLFWGGLLMLVGYGLSCLTRLYDVEPGTETTHNKLAASPVLPPLENIGSRGFGSLLAEPPFVAPPPSSERKENYWMMGKRMVSAPFILFSSGFAFAVLGLFVLLCDVGSLRIGLFRTFGQNPLAAYVIHYMVETTVRPLVPDDSPLWWCLVGLALFFGITWLIVRHLEKQKIFIRL